MQFYFILRTVENFFNVLANYVHLREPVYETGKSGVYVILRQILATYGRSFA